MFYTQRLSPAWDCVSGFVLFLVRSWYSAVQIRCDIKIGLFNFGEKVIYIQKKLYFHFKFGVVFEPAMFGSILSWDVGQLSAAPPSRV